MEEKKAKQFQWPPWGSDEPDAKIGNFLDVVTLNPDGDIDTFVEMWYNIFLWALVSSMFVHLIGCVVAAVAMRKHRFARFLPLLIFTIGVAGPMTGGTITSAVIAWTFQKTTRTLHPFYAMVAGVAQTILLLIISFTKILATL